MNAQIIAAAFAKAKRPLVIVGGPGWSRDIQKKVQAFAERFDLPVAAAFRFQDYIDNRHPCYVGHAGIGLDAKLADAIRNADLLLVIGARLGEMTTSGYTLIDIPNPKSFLIHVHPSGNELGSVYSPDLPINATAQASPISWRACRRPQPSHGATQRRRSAHAYEAYVTPVATPGAVKLEEVVKTVSDFLPDDGIVTNGAGNYAAFVHRYTQYKGYRSCLAPTSGSMGYGLPAAIAAKLAEPTRTVINFAGDGCFMMTGQELATAVQYGLDVVTIVVNNGMYGTIRAHQERQYPDRVSGTTLVNPDFAAYARAFGAHGETVERTEDFRPALERALAARKPAIIEVKTDQEALTPRQTLSEVRAAGKAAQNR